MSLENNEELKNINNEKENNQLNETQIKVKNILKKLLQDALGSPLLKLEKKSSEEFSNIKIISKNFDEFSKKIHFFGIKVEEAIKKKEKDKERTKKINSKNDRKFRNNNISKRTLSSNNVKKTFNSKSHKTITTEEEVEKSDTSKNLFFADRGKAARSNKLQLRTISNFKSVQNKEKPQEKEKETKLENNKNQKKQKINEATNLKKYKTALNKNIIKKGIINQNDSFVISNMNKISIKKNERHLLNNSARDSKLLKGVNYSYDRSNGNTLSDIEEKIEKKNNNNNIINASITSKNKFKEKEKEEKKPIIINKFKLDNKNENKPKDINNINNKMKITNDENINNINNINDNSKQDTIIEDINNNMSIDHEIQRSKTNNFNTNSSKKNISNDKKEIQLLSVKNIVKLVDDVNQSINKILLDGSQPQFQRRYSIRESSRSFVTNKNIEIKEFLNKSPEKVIEEKENIKSYNDTQDSNTNKTKNLNMKCKINYNVFSNENNVRKINKKIKNNNNNNLNNKNNNNNNNNNINSSINKGNTAREKEIKNYNSYRNKKTIKKIMLKSDKNKIEEDEKNNTSNINNPISPIMIKERKIKKGFEIIKKVSKVSKVSNISFINILKDHPKILSKILQYLSFPTRIYFLSISKCLSQERTSLLSNKKEELILILQLKENETIEDKIKTLKNSCSGKDKSLNDKEFKLSKNTIKNLKKLNENQYIKLFKENQINNNKITEINIIYRILLLLLGEKTIAEISDDNNFWKNACKYFLDKMTKEKIGNFIIDKSKNFCFDHHKINSIEFILIGNKNNITNGYYEKLCKTTGLIIPLIKEALDFCGVIAIDTKTRANRLLDNLQYNQKLIYKLNNIIKLHSYK